MDGKVINTPIIANIMAKHVNKPKIIVGTKFEKHSVKNPSDMAIEVVKTAFPTVKCVCLIDSL